MPGLTSTLWMLDLLAGRALAVGADFVLSGPVSAWLQGYGSGPPNPRYTLVTSGDYARALVKAMSVGSRPVARRASENVRGLVFAATVRDGFVEVLSDPSIRVGRLWIEIDVRSLARSSQVAVVGGKFVRLAPPEFECVLLLAEGSADEAKRLVARSGFSWSVFRSFARRGRA